MLSYPSRAPTPRQIAPTLPPCPRQYKRSLATCRRLRRPYAHRPIHRYHGRVGARGRRRRLPAARPPAGLRARPLPRRRRRAGDGDRGQLHQVHGHRRLPAGRRRRLRARRQVGRQARRRPRLGSRLLPRRRHRRVREVHEGDHDPAADRRAVLGQGDGELRRLLEGHRRVHGRRGRRRRQVQGGLRAPQLRPRRLHTLHPLPRRPPHRRLLQGLVRAGVRRRGHRQRPALRGRAGVHHRRARGVAGGQAQPGHQGRRAAEGGRPRRRRAGHGARVGFGVNEPGGMHRASVTGVVACVAGGARGGTSCSLQFLTVCWFSSLHMQPCVDNYESVVIYLD